MKLTPYQLTEYTKLLGQLDAACVLAAGGFPRNDHMRLETCNPDPSASFSSHYAFFKFLANAGRSALAAKGREDE